MTTLNDIFTSARRLDNDVNGNPRYYIPKYMFPAMSDSTRLAAGLYLYRGKKFGAGYVLQTYSLREDVAYACGQIALRVSGYDVDGMRLPA